MNELEWRGLFPSSARRGGHTINKMDPFRNGAASVARSGSPIGRSLNGSSAKLLRPEDFAELTTPSAPLSVASQLLVDAAATPPLRGGEYSAFRRFEEKPAS